MGQSPALIARCPKKNHIFDSSHHCMFVPLMLLDLIAFIAHSRPFLNFFFLSISANVHAISTTSVISPLAVLSAKTALSISISAVKGRYACSEKASYVF
jgi:hypothetical protein